MKTFSPAIILLALIVTCSRASAEELNYNLINLAAHAQEKVDNDILLVTMSSSADADSAQAAAKTVNQQMKWALAALNEAKNIKKQTLNYQTRPRYQNKNIIGWSASQQLQLESDAFEALIGFVGILQERLQVKHMSFGVSPERRQQRTDGLIVDALAAFKSKAQLVAATIGAEDFRIVSINISENIPVLPRRRGIAMETMQSSLTTPPQVEAGESTISVHLDGTIQLVF